VTYFYAVRTVDEDRDLSRAASERYLMMQALSEPTDENAVTTARSVVERVRDRWARRRRLGQVTSTVSELRLTS
jgi:hypothetical protein